MTFKTLETDFHSRIKQSLGMLNHFSHVRLFVTLWTVAHQAPLSMGILQTRILEWVSMPSFRGPSPPRNWTHASCIAGSFFYCWAIREAPNSDICLEQCSLQAPAITSECVNKDQLEKKVFNHRSATVWCQPSHHQPLPTAPESWFPDL